MFPKIIIYTKKMCINYTKYIIRKISENKKLYELFECSKSIHIQTRNLAFKIRNTCEACLFILEQNVFIV